uniref:CS domain-containing protein n=1 Tax=Saimiri boliviensis boliviensis TaxID=39432 RepID=A0A2K6UWF9_SAIBB
MQQKSQKIAALLGNKKPAAVVAPITSGYTVKTSNYEWDQSDKFVKIYITLTAVHQGATENVQVHFTERSFDLLWLVSIISFSEAEAGGSLEVRSSIPA